MTETSQSQGIEKPIGNIRPSETFPVLRVSPPMSQQVYAMLRHMLMIGGFKPGESISLRTLAKRLGTSTMPVREAVNRLIAEQALEILPNRNVIIARMTRHKFVELSRVRQMLESMATEAACEHLSNSLLETLTRQHEAGLAALSGNDVSQILISNKEFHFTLYEAAESEILMPMIEALWMQSGPFQHLSLTMQRTSWDAQHHFEALEALGRRDARAAANAIRADIGDSAQMLLDVATFDD